MPLLLRCRDRFGQVVLGDIIVGIDGREIKLQRELFEALDVHRPGDTIRLDIVRDGRRTDVSIMLGGRDIAALD